MKFGLRLSKAKTEEAVKAAYIKEFKWEVDTCNNYDLKVHNLLFEFKYDMDLTNKDKLAKVLAQAMHYAGRIYRGITEGEVPAALIAADKNEAYIFTADKYARILENNTVDWNRTPCNPCPVLINEVVKVIAGSPYKMQDSSQSSLFGEAITAILNNKEPLARPVTPHTFEDAYRGWSEEIGKYVKSNSVHLIFLEDLRKHNAVWVPEEDRLTVMLHNTSIDVRVPKDIYIGFWNKWLRPPKATDMERIMASADRLKKMHDRRFEGAFFTPPLFCKLAHEYMDKLMDGWKNKVIYDPCAGTGNLEYALGCSNNVWLSTLDSADVKYMQDAAIAPKNQVWQMDYLMDTELPTTFPAVEVVIINPPYGEHGAAQGKAHNKKGVANTVIRTKMSGGIVGRELFAQFMWRVRRDHPKAAVGIFSTLKFMASPSYAKFRDKCWNMKLLGGFIFPASVFSGVKGKFPIAFTVWEPNDKYEGSAMLDVIDNKGLVIGSKQVVAPGKDLNKWLHRDKGNFITVPLKSPVEVFKGRLFQDTACVDMLGAIAFPGIDAQHSSGVAVYSSILGKAGIFRVTPSNLRQSCVMWAVRKLIPNTWINDRDQYSVPNSRLPRQFVADCVAYCLSHGSNQTSSLRGIEYKDKKWDVRNEWVVPTVDELRNYDCSSMPLRSWLRAAHKDSHISSRLTKLYNEMSPEGKSVIDSIKQLWQCYFNNAHLLDLDKWKIADYDAGWWQIKKALTERDRGAAELEAADKCRKILQDKLRPFVYSYGFLPTTMMLTD